jgi:hypothetical protein
MRPNSTWTRDGKYSVITGEPVSRIFVPSSGPGDWRALLAEPDKHWKCRKSARTLAHCWEDADGFPPEIQQILSQNASLANTIPLIILPEWKVNLPGGRRASQNDIWVLAKSGSDLVSMTVEGKVDEPFDKTLGEWKANASSGKIKRLNHLAEVLGINPKAIPDATRYQLLHRTASAVIEAERFDARHAVMLIHSFSHDNKWFDDFAAFAWLFGLKAEIDRLVSTFVGKKIPLHLGWVHGNERYLDA